MVRLLTKNCVTMASQKDASFVESIVTVDVKLIVKPKRDVVNDVVATCVKVVDEGKPVRAFSI